MKPALLQSILPCTSLQEYVRKYQVFRFISDKDVRLPVKYHSPRPEHSITFYVRDTQKFSYLYSDTITAYPPCVINGMYTIPINRYGGYDFLAIKIILQPTTLSRLKIVSVSELNNKFINAEEVLGNQISIICERIRLMNDPDKMIETIESFLIKLIKKRCTQSQPIDNACSYILKQENYICLNWLASQSCLSVRQFIRNFEERIGVSPKMYQKIIRFDKAFRLKNNRPSLDWLYIAIACGYHDYQHLVKDFKEFTHLTPPAFYEIEKSSPERSFALHES